MNIYKYLIGYRIIMKNFQVVLLILFVFCLIPVSSAYSQETQPKDAVQISFQDLEYIEDSEDPHASAYVTIRNSDGELVGISHVHATRHLESTTLALFFEAFTFFLKPLHFFETLFTFFLKPWYFFLEALFFEAALTPRVSRTMQN